MMARVCGGRGSRRIRRDVVGGTAATDGAGRGGRRDGLGRAKGEGPERWRGRRGRPWWTGRGKNLAWVGDGAIEGVEVFADVATGWNLDFTIFKGSAEAREKDGFER